MPGGGFDRRIDHPMHTAWTDAIRLHKAWTDAIRLHKAWTDATAPAHGTLT